MTVRHAKLLSYVCDGVTREARFGLSDSGHSTSTSESPGAAPSLPQANQKKSRWKTIVPSRLAAPEIEGKGIGDRCSPFLLTISPIPASPCRIANRMIAGSWHHVETLFSQGLCTYNFAPDYSHFWAFLLISRWACHMLVQGLGGIFFVIPRNFATLCFSPQEALILSTLFTALSRDMGVHFTLKQTSHYSNSLQLIPHYAVHSPPSARPILLISLYWPTPPHHATPILVSVFVFPSATTTERSLPPYWGSSSCQRRKRPPAFLRCSFLILLD